MHIQLPIEPEVLKKRSITDRFFGSDPKQHFFARAKNVVLSRHFDRKLIIQIESEYGRDLAVDFKDQWHEFLEEIVFHIARDGEVDSREKAFFKEFINVFRIPRNVAAEIYRRGAKRAYIAIVQDLAKDGHLDDADTSRLDAIAKHFGLNEHEQSLGLKDSLGSMVNSRLNDILSDGLISDAEWHDLNLLCNGLGIHLSISPKDQELIDHAREHWRVMYGQLKPITIQDIKLKSGENAHFRENADWLETRKIEGKELYKVIANGSLFLTNHRLLFLINGGNNKSYDWGELLGVRIHSPDEFELERNRGKSPIIAVKSGSTMHRGLSAKIASRLFHAQQ